MSDDAQDGVSRREICTTAGATAGAAAVATSAGPAAAFAATARTRSEVINAGQRTTRLELLNPDYFTVPEADLRQVRSVRTVLGGQVVHT